MLKRDVVGLVLLALGLVAVGVGCLATYGLLREYADVCGETPALEQVWRGGAGLGPMVAVIAVALAAAVVVIARTGWIRASAGLLVVVAVVGATLAGIAGINGKQAAWEADPATYGTCGGYNS